MRALLAALTVALVGCRAHPHVGRRIVVDDTAEARACFAEAQESYSRCVADRVRRGVCDSMRTKSLMLCPGARDATGEPDPTVIQLP